MRQNSVRSARANLTGEVARTPATVLDPSSSGTSPNPSPGPYVPSCAGRSATVLIISAVPESSTKNRGVSPSRIIQSPAATRTSAQPLEKNASCSSLQPSNSSSAPRSPGVITRCLTRGRWSRLQLCRKGAGTRPRRAVRAAASARCRSRRRLRSRQPPPIRPPDPELDASRSASLICRRWSFRQYPNPSARAS